MAIGRVGGTQRGASDQTIADLAGVRAGVSCWSVRRDSPSRRCSAGASPARDATDDLKQIWPQLHKDVSAASYLLALERQGNGGLLAGYRWTKGSYSPP
jgi:hypothetical protein